MQRNKVHSLFLHCRQLYNEWPHAQPSVHGKRSKVSMQHRFGSNITYDRQQWWQEWLAILGSNAEVPSQSTLKPYTHLGKEPVDFVAWRQIVLPTMNVHLLALDKRNEDDQLSVRRTQCITAIFAFPFRLGSLTASGIPTH